MSQTSATSPGTAANVVASGSYTNWIDVNNIKIGSDETVATTANGRANIEDNLISLKLANGSYGTENKSAFFAWSNEPAPYPYFSYGGLSDLWSETLTPSDVNDVDFGV